MLDGFFGIRGLGELEFGKNRKQAAIAGMPVNVVGDLRLVQIADAEQLFEIGQGTRQLSGGHAMRRFPLDQRLVQLAPIRV